MTPDERKQALLSRGYLPKELPPPFTSASLASNLVPIAADWAAYEAGLTPHDRRFFPPITNYARFDMARKGHSRRILSITNPISQYYLTAEMVGHQDEFEDICSRSPISLTGAEITNSGTRAVGMPKLSVLSEKRISCYATAKSILQTDVLSFYHAIYTHSIPWALHGKRLTKRNRSTVDPTVYGNKIDALVRACQDGQTIGIPVGPDTSRILSEIILCAIEQTISPEYFSRLVGGYRYMDDFFLCFATHADAESFLAALRDATSNFDLQLNASKTRIIEALEFNEEGWPGDIAQLRIGRSTDNQRRDLIRFFTEVIRLSKSHPDESIASFAIRKSARTLVKTENWDLYEAFLLRMARENSNCLDSVVKIICTYAAIGYPISARIKDFAERIVEEHAPYNHHFEITWILWLCRSLSIRLDSKATQLVAKIENSLCACLVLLLRSRNLLSGRGAVSDWTGTVSSEDLFGEHWLLVYESSLRRGWNVPGAEAAVNDNRLFRTLRENNVSFFNTAATNIALDLPSIGFRLDQQLGRRRNAILPGAIYAERTTPLRQRRYEKLGEDYGDDDSGSFFGFDDLTDNQFHDDFEAI